MTIAIDRVTGRPCGQHVPPAWGSEPVGLVRLLAPMHPNANPDGIVYVDAASVRLEETND